jgi:hypothetical protein
MTKDDFRKLWSGVTPEERRKQLDSLDMTNETDEERWWEHDALAELVAEDEEKAKVDRIREMSESTGEDSAP